MKVAAIVIVIGIIWVGIVYWLIYRPSIDITRNGDVLIWYDENFSRSYKKLFNIFGR